MRLSQFIIRNQVGAPVIVEMRHATSLLIANFYFLIPNS